MQKYDRALDASRNSYDLSEEKTYNASLISRQAEQNITMQNYERALDASMKAYALSEEIGDLQGESLTSYNGVVGEETRRQHLCK